MVYVLALFLAASSVFGEAASAMTVFVSCGAGDDQSPGASRDAPLRTLQAARDKMRALRSAPGDKGTLGVVHVLAAATEEDPDAGRCELTEPLELDDRDSGTQWLSDGGRVLISGGRRLALNTLPAGVVEVDLKAQGINDFGQLRARGYSGGSACILTQNYEPSALELFYRDATSTDGPSSEEREMVLARYPDLSYPVAARNWMKVGSVNGSNVAVSADMKARMAGWRNASAIAAAGGAWTHGLWMYNWADSHRPVQAFDAERGELTLGEDDVGRDVTLRRGSNFYVYNLRDELDQPGEYHIDVSQGTLAFLPPAVQRGGMCQWTIDIGHSDEPGQIWKTVVVAGPADDRFAFVGCSAESSEGRRCVSEFGAPRGVRLLGNKAGNIVATGACCDSVTNEVLSTTQSSCEGARSGHGTYFVSLATTVLAVAGASDVSFTGFEVRHSRGAAITLRNCQRVVLHNSSIGDAGMMALNVTGGIGCGLVDSTVEGAGDVGVVLDGGDRQTLEPSGHFVERSVLHQNQRWILNYAPHVLLAGVGNAVRSSELYNTPQMAIFMQGNDHELLDSYIHDAAQQCSDCGALYMGRDWTYRGNAVRRNVWRRISSVLSGDTNAIYLDDLLSSVSITDNIFDGIARVLQLRGGRDNEFSRNLINASGDEPVRFDNPGEGGDRRGCHPGGLPFDFLAAVPYNTSDAWKRYPNLSNILEDDPCRPKYNVFSDNVMCHGARNLVDKSPGTIAAWASTANNNTQCATESEGVDYFII